MVKYFDHLNKLKFSTVQPTAFTERGLYMLATILKSERAARTTITIIDTFTKVREIARTMEDLQKVDDGGNQQKTLLQKVVTCLPMLLAVILVHKLLKQKLNLTLP